VLGRIVLRPVIQGSDIVGITINSPGLQPLP